MVNMEQSNIRFQKLQMSDLALMHQWINTPHVREWWKDPNTFEAVREQYGAMIEGRDPTRPYFITYDSNPIGFIQIYKFSDNPEWLQAVEPLDEAVGVDLFIGHPDYIHRGLGSLVLRKFLQEIVFERPEIESCLIDPEPANKIAIRAYEKAGFTYWKTLEDGPDGPAYIMRITRAEFLASPPK